jgi:hypothetical protein
VSIRKMTRRVLLVVCGTVLALSAMAAPAAASSPKPFHLEKTCGGFTCLVTASSFKKIPAGTVISYSGTSLDALVATINVRHGSATGDCNIASVFGDPQVAGRCLFDTGTGRLHRFHLDVAVTLDTTGVWHWDGTYHFGRGDGDGDHGQDH